MSISIVHFIYSKTRKKQIPPGTPPLLHRTPQSSPKKKKNASKAKDAVVITGESKPTRKASDDVVITGESKATRKPEPDIEVTSSFKPTSKQASRGVKVFEDQLTMRQEWIPHRNYHPEWIIQPEVHRPTNCPA